MAYSLNLAGEWEACVLGLGCFSVRLPGTLDTNGVGGADKPHLRTRFTRKHTFEGTVRYRRRVQLPALLAGERLFLRIERTREAALFVDGSEVRAYKAGTLATPYLYELTDVAPTADEARTVELCIQVDNRYTAFPRESLINASAATDETQTNWNGVIGDITLYTEPNTFIRAVRAYPVENAGNAALDVQVECDGVDAAAFLCRSAALRLESAALARPATAAHAERVVPLEDGRGVLVAFRALALKADCARWDDGEGNLHELTATLTVQKSGRGRDDDASAVAQTQATADDDAHAAAPRAVVSTRTVAFGIRSFAVGSDARLLLNGRRFFLRGEANCAVFPETGHPPMDEGAWRTMLSAYRAYGVNCMRFHSWCPPDAAFYAADKLGMLMQPELSQWNFSNAFGSEKARAYYEHELFAILRSLANHPSFVMLTFGNELQYTDEGEAHAKRLLARARSLDPTRLYAKSSNYHYGNKGVDDESDFYTAAKIRTKKLRAIGSPMRGHLNEQPPCATTDYSDAMTEAVQKRKAVFGFEVGQYEILPDDSELASFAGVTEPVNYALVQEDVTAQGFRERWNDYVEATGELALLCYREEVEAVLRTPSMSGLSLLGLQDFPGQGTALVGMMNAHLAPKPFAFAQAERFRAFFCDALPLLYLPRYTWRAGETLSAAVKFAYYGKERVTAVPLIELFSGEERIYRATLPETRIDGTGLFPLGSVQLPLPACADGNALRLNAVVRVGSHENRYPLWVYPPHERITANATTERSACAKASGGVTATTQENAAAAAYKNVIITQKLSDALLAAVEAGATAFFDPPCTAEHIPASVESHFTTDFWSVGTFPVQSGTMGLYIDAAHPAMRGFPTETHANYQWWRLSKSRAMMLPAHIQPIVAVPDCIDRMRHLGLLFEARYGSGRLLVSSMGLLSKQDECECAALLHSLLAYAEETACMPPSAHEAHTPATAATMHTEPTAHEALAEPCNTITREALVRLFGQIE